MSDIKGWGCVGLILQFLPRSFLAVSCCSLVIMVNLAFEILAAAKDMITFNNSIEFGRSTPTKENDVSLGFFKDKKATTRFTECSRSSSSHDALGTKALN